MFQVGSLSSAGAIIGRSDTRSCNESGPKCAGALAQGMRSEQSYQPLACLRLPGACV